MKVDLTYLKNMSAGNKELVLEMIGIFKNQVDEFVSDMYSLYKEGSYEQLGRLAHKAKSSISIMGLNELAKELKSFELKAKAGEQVEDYPAFIKRFELETADAVKELNDVSNNLENYF